MKLIIIIAFCCWLYKSGIMAEIINACELSERQAAPAPARIRKKAPAPRKTPTPAPAAPLRSYQAPPRQVLKLERYQLETAAKIALQKKGYKKAAQIAGSQTNEVLIDIINGTY